MRNTLRTPQDRKVQISLTLSMTAIEMADAITDVLEYPSRSSLVEELIRRAAQKHLPEGSVERS